MLRILLFIFIISASYTSYAIFNININGGKVQAYSVAVIPYDIKQGYSAVEKTILTDLSRSSNITLVDRELFFETPKYDDSSLNLYAWNLLGVDYVILTKEQDGKLQLRLYDITRSKWIVDGQIFKSTLLSRHLAHSISDFVYEKITGLKSIFSKRLIYIEPNRDDGIYRLIESDYDGYNPELLLELSQIIASPEVSPDNKYIVVSMYDRDASNIVIYDRKNRTHRIIARTVHGTNVSPSFSPDSRHIVYSSSRDGFYKLYLYNISSRQTIKLMDDEFINIEPAFSHDGEGIYFTSNRENNNPQIYYLHRKNGDIKRITQVGDYNTASQPLDKNHLILLSRNKLGYAISLYNIENKKHLFLGHSSFDGAPAIIKNHNYAAYAAQSDLGEKLFLMELNSGKRVKIPTIFDIHYPTWGEKL